MPQTDSIAHRSSRSRDPKYCDVRLIIDASIEGDEQRAKYAQWILEKKHPALLTLHLIALDHIEHETGPFSPESIAILERLDTAIGTLRATAERIAKTRRDRA